MHNTQIELSSKNRDVSLSSSKEDVIIKMNKQLKQFKSFSINNISIPNSFYNITGSNNRLVVTQGAQDNILISLGNYTSNTLATTIQTALIGSTVLSSNVWTVIFDVHSLKYTITSDTAFTIDSGSTIGFNMGFQTLPTALDTVVISDSSIFLSPGINIYVKSNILSSGLIQRPYYNSLLNSIVCSVPINAQPGGIVQYNPGYEMKFSYIVPRNIDYIDIQLLDSNFNVINLNGLDWSMVLNIVTE